MMKRTRIGWIRHGITPWNELGKIQGTTDIPLSVEGERQAKLLADRLAADGELWDGIVSSDLARAFRTAETISERLHIPLERDARLRERAFGSAEGTTLQERLDRWGDEWRKRVPDQETDEQLMGRGLAFLEELTAKHEGESWLVVSHGSFLGRMLQSICEGLDDSHLRNVSLTILEQNGERWIPLLHNCTAHLDGLSKK